MKSSAMRDAESNADLAAAPRDESWKDDSRKILSFLRDASESSVFRASHPGALAYLLARSLESVRKPLVLVVPTDRDVERAMDAVNFFWGKNGVRADSPLNRRVWAFPSRSGHKSHSLGKSETTARRVETLYAMRSAPSPCLVVTSALALMERIIPPEVLIANADYKVVGDQMDLDSFARRLVDCSYCRVALVEEYGDFSSRGGVVDVYAPLYRWPLRLEFFGEELESIRLFHPSTQRSLGNLQDAVLLPGSEIILDEAARKRAVMAIYEDVRQENLTPAAGNVWLEAVQEGRQLGGFDSILSVFFEKTATLMDYMDRASILVWSDAALAGKILEEHHYRVLRDWTENHTPNEWRRPPAELFQDPEQLLADTERFQQVSVNGLTEPAGARVFDLGARGHDELTLAVQSHAKEERLLEPLAKQLKAWRKNGVRSFLVSAGQEQAKRLAELLDAYGVETDFSPHPFGEESFDSPSVKVLSGSIERGFYWPAEKLAVISEEEIFGRRSRRRSRKTVSGLFLNSFQDLKTGDFVVHVDHGIGIYKELVHLSVRGIESDFLLLAYHANDRLYVPVDKLQKVQKYLGIEGQNPKVDKLGGKSWEAVKKKASEAAERIAEELLELYASRQVREGFRYSPPDHAFQEFEATFAYEETPDQMKAIDDVLDDMASTRPMDRLICGDVGYGKTEVAIRAAFKAVMDGKQVGMLVPTTILAEQHHQAFLERFDKFAIRVESLSRFKTPAQQKEVLEGLKKGAIDIVIGTHRLLQKDVQFKDLGLLIVDEEHRFGVKHKEMLKRLRVSVDVLTLTATPIPRTLQMSLTGIRDLSTIETPPQDRRVIESHVCTRDDLTIKEAIYRELHRGGQVFFVHNHVKTIYQVASSVGKLVPEARIAVAHGQMKERELEKVMLDFINRKVDVLVCTTIIESGLDIPAANTIIIDRADKLGLAQIYQLRGRVGRSSEQAYAYLLIPGEHLVSRDALKRLRALMDFSELGAGFKIALNDLQIRGGGTILGSSQSGHVAAVGYELYLELLEGKIREMKGERVEEEVIDPEITVPVSAFLPESFIPDTDQRLIAYKRLATASESGEIDELAAEWRDRYGPFPESTRSLLLLALTRLLCRKLGIVKLDGEGDLLTLHFAGASSILELIAYLNEKKCTVIPESDCKLRVEVWAKSPAQRLLRLKKLLQEFLEHASPFANQERRQNH